MNFEEYLILSESDHKENISIEEAADIYILSIVIKLMLKKN